MEESVNVLRTTATHGIVRPATGLEHFRLERRAPAPALADRIARHWTVCWDLRGREPFTQEVLPHPCVNLVFQDGRGGLFAIPRGRDARRLEGAGEARATKLRPGALHGLGGLAPAAMAGLVGGQDCALTAAFGADAARLEHEVVDMGSDEHVEAVETFLMERLPDEDPAYALVSAVVDELLIGGPGLRIEALAAGHGVSTRTLQRAFRELVGVGPKWVAQRYRLHEAAERIAAGEAEDHTDLALSLGFYDLAHLIRQFTTAMGVSPGAYAEACAG